MQEITTIVVYPLLCAALYYLGAWATITAPIHTRFPGWLRSFVECAACSGFWYGGLAAILIGRLLGLPFIGLDGVHWATPVIVGVCSIFWTPILGARLLWGMVQVSKAIDVLQEEAPELPPLPAPNNPGPGRVLPLRPPTDTSEPS